MIDSDSSVIRPITLFSDEPTSEDKFGTHKAIAKTLNEIIDFEHKKKHEIKKPFVVGLFGKWGSGKSSIIQMLKDNIKNHSIVEVDAWSVGSRHFPRQVIRCCAEQLNIAENKRVKELLPDIEKEEQVDDVEWKPSKAAGMFATIFIIVVVGLVILSFYDMYYKKDWPLEVVTPLIITALAFWFISWYLPRHSVTTTKSSKDLFAHDPKYFRGKLVKVLEATRDKNDICIIVDNIDRFESDEALQILRTLKTFITRDNDFKRLSFIIPCDPEQIISNSLKDSNKFANPNESLRKYFNVVVNIPLPIWSDLEGYATELLKEINIGLTHDDVAEISSSLEMVYDNNPRQIKQFINNFSAQFRLASLLQEERNISPNITVDVPLLSFFLILHTELRGENVPDSIEKLRTFGIGENDKKNVKIGTFIKSRNVIWDDISNELWRNLFYLKDANKDSGFNEYKILALTRMRKEFIELCIKKKPDLNSLLSYLRGQSKSKTDQVNLAEVILNAKLKGIDFYLLGNFKTMVSQFLTEGPKYWLQLPPEGFYREIIMGQQGKISQVLKAFDQTELSKEDPNYEQGLPLKIDEHRPWIVHFLMALLADNPDALDDYETLESLVVNIGQSYNKDLIPLVLEFPEQSWSDNAVNLAIDVWASSGVKISSKKILGLVMKDDNSFDRPPELIGKIIKHSLSIILEEEKNNGDQAYKLNTNEYRIVNKLLLGISSGILNALGADITELSATLNANFSAIKDWKERYNIIRLQKIIYDLQVEGVDKNVVQEHFKFSLFTSLELADINTLTKIVKNFKEDVIALASAQLNTAATRDEEICHLLLNLFIKNRQVIFQYVLSHKAEWLNTWLKTISNLSLVEIHNYQNLSIDLALGSAIPKEIYCRMLPLLPAEEGTTIYDERMIKFDSIIDANPASSEENLTNILNAFIWSSQEPTKDQFKKISEKVKTTDLPITSDEFRELLKKFKSLRN